MSFIKKERGDFEVPRHKGSYSRQCLVSLKLYNKSHPQIPFHEAVTPHRSALNAPHCGGVHGGKSLHVFGQEESNTNSDLTKLPELSPATCNRRLFEFSSEMLPFYSFGFKSKLLLLLFCEHQPDLAVEVQ